MKELITLQLSKTILVLSVALLSFASKAQQDVVITTEVCSPATEVRLTGPWWSWAPNGGPVAVDNGNGTWTFTLSPAPTANMEYLLVVDGVQENLITDMQNGGTCAPITDFATYANRQWLTTDPLSINNTYDQCGPCSQQTDLIITTEVCSPATEVRLTGPWWGWDPTGGPTAVDNGNGTWSFTLSPAPTADMEYLLVVDGVQEDLISEMQNGGTCAPITDLATYANRQWLTTDPLSISNTYGQCGPCAPQTNLDITVDVCGSASEVRMTGPFWGWDPAAGPFATDNGDGTWTFTISPEPTTNMEYLIVVDGVQENLIQDMQNGGSCAPITDYFSYANRIWNVGAGNVTGINYDRCVSCDIDDLVITTEVCDTTLIFTELSLTGPIWNWDPNAGPDAVDNGDGTWTFTFSPAPADSFEYILAIDGTEENLVTDMINGGDCAPVTDFSTYAHRRWVSGDGNVNNTFDQCHTCAEASLDETIFEALSVFPVPASDVIYIEDETVIGSVIIYSLVGQKVIEGEFSTTNGSLSLEDLTQGVYYLTVHRDGASSVHQIVKQ